MFSFHLCSTQIARCSWGEAAKVCGFNKKRNNITATCIEHMHALMHAHTESHWRPSETPYDGKMLRGFWRVTQCRLRLILTKSCSTSCQAYGDLYISLPGQVQPTYTKDALYSGTVHCQSSSKSKSILSCKIGSDIFISIFRKWKVLVHWRGRPTGMTT